MSDTITRDEMLLNSIANHENSGLTPITREEQYLSYISGETNLYPITPITRKERFLAKIAQNGIGGGSGGGGDEMTELDAVIEGSCTEVKLLKATRIKDYGLAYCGLLENIEMPMVTEIGTYAFYKCANLASVSLPSGLTNLSAGVFYDCTNLAEISLHNGITSIGKYAFTNCSKIKSITFPSSLTTISDAAFQGSTALLTVTFKGTPTSISSRAFNGLSNIKTINVPWAEGAVASAPWGATKATINYNYTGG